MPTLDYQTARMPRKPLVRRVAMSMRNISWLLLAASILGVAVSFFVYPGEMGEPYASFYMQLNEEGPVLNMLGGVTGVAGCLLGARWSLLALPLHIIVGLQWVSFGIA